MSLTQHSFGWLLSYLSWRCPRQWWRTCERNQKRTSNAPKTWPCALVGWSYSSWSSSRYLAPRWASMRLNRTFCCARFTACTTNFDYSSESSNSKSSRKSWRASKCRTWLENRCAWTSFLAWSELESHACLQVLYLRISSLRHIVSWALIFVWQISGSWRQWKSQSRTQRWKDRLFL